MAFSRQQQNTSNEEISSLAIRGWQNSKLSSTADGGIQSLKTFLLKKAARPILDSQIQGDAFIISVKSSDEHRFTHLNNFLWAQTTITVDKAPSSTFNHSNQQRQGSKPTFQPPNAPRHQNNSRTFNNPPNGPQQRSNSRPNQRGPQRQNGDNVAMGDSPFAASNPPPLPTSDIEAAMIAVIRRRYIAETKYLTFESLALEPDFQATGLSNSTASKVFAALFVCCEKSIFETPRKRREMVESLSLSNNSLTTAKDVIAAASTFPNTKNLDLSHNQITDVGELRYWKNQFRNLEHLILSDNPCDLKPDTKTTILRWYPKLKMYNNQPVTSQSNLLSHNNTNLQQAPTPPQSTSPVYPLPTEPHPEFPAGSTFGVATPDKPQEILLKEQMGLKFSYETRLKMQYVEQCLTANNFNYDAAIADLQAAMTAGNVPADAFLQI